jgi:Family of unknown function (DUF6535)
MSVTLVWFIIFNIRYLFQQSAAQNVALEYTALYYYATHSRISPENSLMASRASVSSIPHPTHSVIDWSPPSIIRKNMFWMTSLVFSFSSAAVAAFGRKMARHYRHMLVSQQYGRLSINARTRNPSVDRVQWSVDVWMDLMYRLLHVATLIFLLGDVDSFFKPISVTVLAAFVICGLHYIFGAFR